jgi:branched-chain amino acid transport system permease protein
MVVLSLTVGVLVYIVLMRKMTGQMVLAAILTTIAIGILLRGFPQPYRSKPRA